MTSPQLPLPGFDPPPPRVRRGRGVRSHARVWSDPAVGLAAATAQARFDDWRSGFARALASLSSEQRAALRRRLGGSGR